MQWYQDLRLIVEKEFWVKRVALKAYSFEGNLKSIQNLQYDDYEKIKQGNLKLTGTSFTMIGLKNADHLICKHLIAKFMKELRAKSREFIPMSLFRFTYIIQSNCQNCIAERFQEGEFTKYNDNWGFFLDNDTIINKIVQAFPFYTYYPKYMICDIQGVGFSFTYPSIFNMIQGESSDKTDMGQYGQLMYIKSFQDKKYLAREILGNIGIMI